KLGKFPCFRPAVPLKWHCLWRLNTMRFASFLLVLSLLVFPAKADYPKPSPYPISWELTFQHDKPKRIVVNVPGRPAPVAYWYLMYSVTNKTDQEQTFLPFFEMA